MQDQLPIFKPAPSLFGRILPSRNAIAKRHAEATKPPPRRHFALANLSRTAKNRIRLPARQVDSQIFDNDAIRPYPEWPLICKDENRLCFDSEQACKKWLAKFMMDKNIETIWFCPICDKFHHQCYPLEVSGQSSGKTTRKDYHKSL